MWTNRFNRHGLRGQKTISCFTCSAAVGILSSIACAALWLRTVRAVAKGVRPTRFRRERSMLGWPSNKEMISACWFWMAMWRDVFSSLSCKNHSPNKSIQQCSFNLNLNLPSKQGLIKVSWLHFLEIFKDSGRVIIIKLNCFRIVSKKGKGYNQQVKTKSVPQITRSDRGVEFLEIGSAHICQFIIMK